MRTCSARSRDALRDGRSRWSTSHCGASAGGQEPATRRYVPPSVTDPAATTYEPPVFTSTTGKLRLSGAKQSASTERYTYCTPPDGVRTVHVGTCSASRCARAAAYTCTPSFTFEESSAVVQKSSPSNRSRVLTRRAPVARSVPSSVRSEERRVGKECSSRCRPCQ